MKREIQCVFCQYNCDDQYISKYWHTDETNGKKSYVNVCEFCEDEMSYIDEEECYREVTHEGKKYRYQ